MIVFLLLLLSVPSAWASENPPLCVENGVEVDCHTRAVKSPLTLHFIPVGGEKVIEGATSCANSFTAQGGGCLKPLPGWPPQTHILWDTEAAAPIVEIFNMEECRSGKAKCKIYLDPVLGVQVTRDRMPITDCLAKMEAAMKAMEHFLDHLTFNDDGSITNNLSTRPQIEYFSTDPRDPRMKKQLKALNEAHNKAYEQWESTKRDCFRNP